MSLESEIVKLTKAVEELTRALQSVPVAKAEQAPVEAAVPVPTKKAAKKPSENGKDAPTEKEDTTHQSMVDLCMSIVKEDRSKGPQVKEIISSFGGAKVVGSVSAGDLPGLKAKLEALRNGD